MAGSSLAGQVVLVTGASSGIGRAAARELVQAGARVALVARRRGALEALAAELSAAGPGAALAVPADVTDEAAVEAMVRATVGAFGTLDALVSAAGAGDVAPVGGLAGADLDRLWAVNARGAILAARHVAPLFMAQGRGTIVQVGSVSALRGWPRGTAYVASKFALRGATECLRAELRPHGVRVVHICPDLTDTGLFAAAGIVLSGGEAMLDAVDVARTIRFALELPERAELSEVVLRPLRRT